MKPPVVHQTVQPSAPSGGEEAQDAEDRVQPGDITAADDGRDVRVESTEGPRPGLVGGFGPLVETSVPDRDGAADDERETR